MPFRVTPKEASVYGDHEMPSSTSLQPEVKEVSIASDSTTEQENVNEQLLKELDEIYSPVLKVMKLFGAYLGHSSLRQSRQVTGSRRKRLYLETIYCSVVASGFWLNFVIAFVDIFFGANPYVFIMFSLWCLLIALSGTICLMVLCSPLADMTKSRFANFLRGLMAVNRNVNLEKVKNKSSKGLIVFWAFFIAASVGTVTTEQLVGFNITNSIPWNQWSGFNVISALFLFIGCGVWFLPILFFYITCLILEEVFDELHRRMSSLHPISMGLSSLRMEFYKLCEVVELADKMLAPLLLGMVSVYIPLICFNSYQVVNLPQEGKMVFLISNIFWLLAGASVFAIILLNGSNVSEKVRGIWNNFVCRYHFFNHIKFVFLLMFYTF